MCVLCAIVFCNTKMDLLTHIVCKWVNVCARVYVYVCVCQRVFVCRADGLMPGLLWDLSSPLPQVIGNLTAIGGATNNG